MHMCEGERRDVVFSAAQTSSIVLSLGEQEEKEIENKLPPKVRFLAEGWENINDVMVDGCFVGLGVFSRRRWG